MKRFNQMQEFKGAYLPLENEPLIRIPLQNFSLGSEITLFPIMILTSDTDCYTLNRD